MNSEDVLRSFGMSALQIETELEAIEAEQKIRIGHDRTVRAERDSAYYPQFEESIRIEAAAMARHYEIFYCLEKSMRKFIREMMEEAHGSVWWTGKVPPAIGTAAEDRIKKERDSAISRRSSDPLDYTNFGELGEIIKANWDVFGGVFDSQKGVERVMSQLNLLRNPIAHCSPLAEDEVDRLHLAMRDWFREMS